MQLSKWYWFQAAKAAHHNQMFRLLLLQKGRAIKWRCQDAANVEFGPSCFMIERDKIGFEIF